VNADDRTEEIDWDRLSSEEHLALTLFRRNRFNDTKSISEKMDMTEAEAERLLHAAREKGRKRE
jgi:DNA-binding transcriptional regulator LsrR (DeoR family)